MTTFLNSYATKAYAEHPIASWPLDDDAYYISLMSESEKLSKNWDIKNCIMLDSSPDVEVPPSPFDDDNWKTIALDNSSTISKNISNIAPTGTTITITTNGSHKLRPGQFIKIDGVNPSSYNIINAEILATPSNNKVTISSTVTDAYISGGTLTCNTKTIEFISSNIFRLDELNKDLQSF